MQINPITPAERILRHRNEQEIKSGHIRLLQCSWCKKYNVGGEWVEHYTPLIAQIISHGICPFCAEKEKEKLHA
jgi:hypothetical protein